MEKSRQDVWFNGFAILLGGQWRKAVQISTVCRAWACYYRPGNQMISLAPEERPSLCRMARDMCNMSVKCLLQTCTLEDLVTNRWLLFGVVVELSEGEAPLKVIVGGGSWGLWSSPTIVHSLLLGLLYMEPSLTVSDHRGWGHTHHHAFPAVLVNFLVAVTKYLKDTRKGGAQRGLQFEGTAHRGQHGHESMRKLVNCICSQEDERERQRQRGKRDREGDRDRQPHRDRDTGWSVGP